MSNLTNHERPGVYTAYEASSIVRGSSAGGMVGLVAVEAGADAPEAVFLYGYEEAVSVFGESSHTAKLAKLLFQNGASAVAACAIGNDSLYGEAFEALGEVEDISILVCDSGDQTVHQKLKEAVEEASKLRKERIAVVCGGKGETVAALVARAQALNCERMVLVAPESTEEALAGPALAAAVAGAIAGETDPAVPLGGTSLAGISNVSQVYSEESVDALIRGGVTVVERTGGEICVIRGMTTRTKTGSAADNTWRELTTIRIVDDVIPAVRDALRARFMRSKNTGQVRSAIRSQVIMELENKLEREIINDYGEVTVQALEDNPTVCLVEFSFTVTHGLNQIWLSAKITV